MDSKILLDLSMQNRNYDCILMLVCARETETLEWYCLLMTIKIHK